MPFFTSNSVTTHYEGLTTENAMLMTSVIRSCERRNFHYALLSPHIFGDTTTGAVAKYVVKLSFSLGFVPESRIINSRLMIKGFVSCLSNLKEFQLDATLSSDKHFQPATVLVGAGLPRHLESFKIGYLRHTPECFIFYRYLPLLDPLKVKVLYDTFASDKGFALRGLIRAKSLHTIESLGWIINSTLKTEYHKHLCAIQGIATE